ncbi:MAG: zf-HC2 domain-containing protein [Tumebacillaceae bacterium]
MAVYCQEREEQMHRYLDEEMSVEERQEFETHVAACSACRDQLQMLGTGVNLLIRAEWVKAPPNFTEKLMAQLKQIDPPRRNWRVPVMKYAGIAAALLLVLGTGMMMATPDQFALQATDRSGLIVQNGKVIVPEGTQYDGDLLIQNGDVEVRGIVNGNVTAYNGRVLRMAGADISGETQEVDEVMEKMVYYGKRLWNDVTTWAQ